jgi:NADP-dependent 3-hydroxy acid dehydrogenase YdfG
VAGTSLHGICSTPSQPKDSAWSLRGIAVGDLNIQAVTDLATEVDGISFQLDVANEASVNEMVSAANAAFGPIDLMCLNAGIATGGDLTVSNEVWQRTWDVNVMSHVYGVRAVLPQMLDLRSGYLLHTASAAGLLTHIAATPYSVTKHAVVALAEWLSITYGTAGMKMSCLSPQFVATSMLDSVNAVSPGFADLVAATSITAKQVAEDVVASLAAEPFHILPHPEVAAYMATRATDPELWLRSMRDLQHTLGAEPGQDWPAATDQ